jgi:hypothetical protein
MILEQEHCHLPDVSNLLRSECPFSSASKIASPPCRVLEKKNCAEILVFWFLSVLLSHIFDQSDHFSSTEYIFYILLYTFSSFPSRTNSSAVPVRVIRNFQDYMPLLVIIIYYK